jgi:membrane-associated protease RseP (regulator of RpoE activity)
LDPARLDERPEPFPDATTISERFTTPVYWPVRQKFQDRRWRHALLLALTILSTTYVGAIHYLSFQADIGAVPSSLRLGWSFFLHGLWYSVTVLSILGCHELGHYLACRYYNVDASLPFFIPMPFLLTGTMGAFIRIREPIPTKRQLFDIGIAGPIAGFLIVVPALVIGISLSRVVRLPETYEWFGEPLLFKIVQRLIWGPMAPGYSLNTHPVLFGAWFGMLATALNLLPIAQLDGGHISYAVFGRKSSIVTLVGVGCLALMTAFVSLSWLVWTLLLIVMLFTFGRHHPRTFDEDQPLDRTRLILAGVALAMLVLSFTPVPFSEITGR